MELVGRNRDFSVNRHTPILKNPYTVNQIAIMNTQSEDLFKENLNSISDILRRMHEMEDFSADLVRRSVDLILDCSNSLPEEKAQQLVQGLSDLAGRLERHFDVESALIIALRDRDLVPSEVLLAILKHPLVMSCPSLVHEQLYGSIPEHQRSE